MVFSNEQAAAQSLQQALDENKADLNAEIQKGISEHCRIDEIEVVCAWIAGSSLSPEVIESLSQITELRKQVSLKRAEFVPEQRYKIFQSLTPSQVKLHATHQLANSGDRRSQIVANLISLGPFKACREIGRLSNEFEKDDAYAALIDASMVAQSTGRFEGKPYKATSVIKTGEYDTKAQHFSGSNEVHISDYVQKNCLSIRGGETKVGNLGVELEVASCSTKALQAYHYEKTGQLVDFPHKLNINYAFRTATDLLSVDIPASEEAAKRIVAGFNSPYRTKDVPFSQHRPMFVIFTFQPDYSKKSVLGPKRGELEIDVLISDVAFYPLLKPTEYQHSWGGVDLGFPEQVYFEGTRFPSSDALYHFTPAQF